MLPQTYTNLGLLQYLKSFVKPECTTWVNLPGQLKVGQNLNLIRIATIMPNMGVIY